MLGYLLSFALPGSAAALASENNATQERGLGHLITVMDSWIEISFMGLELGKAILMAAVLLFFFSIRRQLARLTAMVVNRYLIGSKDVMIHAHFVKAIQSPLSYFLMFYSFGLALDIFYYPDPANKSIAQWINIIYVVLFAWCIVKLVAVYGEYALGSMIQSNDNLRKEVVNMAMKLAYFAIFVFALVWILQILEYNISAIVASLGIGGLAVALAAKDTLANFFGSVMILLDNSFSQGDWIECNGIEGTVVEIGLRRTTIRTFDNAMMFVPNAMLADQPIRNWNRRKVGRRLKMQIGLTYDSPPEKIRECTEAIRQMLYVHEGIATPEEEDEPDKLFYTGVISRNDLHGYKRTFMVYLNEFSPSSIDILVYCFVRSVNWEDFLRTKEDVMYKIIEIVHAHSLSFAFPSQSIYVEDFPWKEEEKKELLES